jgi:hypothetical protein
LDLVTPFRVLDSRHRLTPFSLLGVPPQGGACYLRAGILQGIVRS